MEKHDCNHEREFGEITTLLAKVSKEVYGNGEDGLSKTVPRLEMKINDLCGSVASHTKVISNFIEYQASHNGEEKGKKEEEVRTAIATELKSTRKRDKIQRVFLFIMAFIAVIGLSLTAYFSFTSNKQLPKVEDKLTNEIRLMDGVSKVQRNGYVKINDNGLTDSVKVR